MSLEPSTESATPSEPITSEPADTIPAPDAPPEPAPNVEDFIAPAEEPPLADTISDALVDSDIPVVGPDPSKMQIPEYNLRENISAVKIAGVQLAGASILVIPAEDNITSFTVSRDWVSACNPQPGDYCVLRDGKPHHIILAKDFEATYAPVL